MKHIFRGLIILFVFSMQAKAQFDLKIFTYQHTMSGDTVNACQDTISFFARAEYSTGDEVNYLNARFSWDFGDGVQQLITNTNFVKYTYNQGGAFFVSVLVEDEFGDKKSVTIPVRVSPTPWFTGTQSLAARALCSGENVDLHGEVQVGEQKFEPAQQHSEETPRQINRQKKYESIIHFSIFEQEASMQTAEQFQSLCLDMEHSDQNGLQISLTCPNATSVILKDFGGDSLTHLGEPVALSTNPFYAGKTYSYCWNQNPQYGTMQSEAKKYFHDYTDKNGKFYKNVSYLPDGSYASSETLSKLVGCPLNGDWKLTVLDNNFNDDGFVVAWNLSFSNQTPTREWHYNYNYPTAKRIWKGENVTPTLAGANASAKPATRGERPYQFEVTDNFGCRFDTTVNVMVEGVSFTYSPNKAEILLPLEFTSTVSWATTWSWNFDDGTLADTSKVVHKFTDNRVFNVKLKVTSPTGCTDSTYNEINVIQPTLQLLVKTAPDAAPGKADTLQVCQNSEITLVALAKYSNNTDTMFYYETPYFWDFGDGATQTQEKDFVTHAYTDGGAYYITLYVGDNRENKIEIPVRVSMTPQFDSTKSSVDKAICKTDAFLLTGKVIPQPWDFEIQTTKKEEISVQVNREYVYSTSFIHRLFNRGHNVNDTDRVKNVCIKMEHSNLNDLEIKLTCPNGQYIVLKEKNTGVDNVFLGEPTDKENPDFEWVRGTAYSYCFNETAQYGTMNQEGGKHTYTFTDKSDSTYKDHYYLPEGSYLPYDSFDKLIGCPFNGEWKITVGDENSTDNGFIYETSLAFSDSIKSGMWQFTNSYNNIEPLYWEGEQVTSTRNGSEADVKPIDKPFEIGSLAYIYKVRDDFSCPYDTTINVEVTNASFTAAPMQAIANKDEVKFTNTTDWATDFEWDFGDKTGEKGSAELTHIYETENIFKAVLKAISESGCYDLDTVEIEVTYQPSTLEIPNVFTPDGDNKSDIFKVKVEAKSMQEFDARVYTRWGKRVYQWTDPENGGWDGKIGNIDASPGVYYLVIKAKGKDGKEHPDNGKPIFFYLIRDK